MLQGEENDSCCTPSDVAKSANSAALNLLPLMSTKIYKKAYGPRAEKCYFTPANGVLKFNFTPARAKKKRWSFSRQILGNKLSLKTDWIKKKLLCNYSRKNLYEYYIKML
jgi:hypothetical protein